jgi:hypothetical protein
MTAYPEPHYAPGWDRPVRRGTDGFAVAAIVTALLGLGPLALGLGITGLVTTRRRGTAGRGIAIAAVVLGALETLALLVGAVLLGISWLQSRPLPADVSAPRDANAVQLVVGNCLADLPPDGDVETVRVVPCADPHAARIASSYTFAPAAVWPGQGDADALVARSCVLTADEQDLGATVVTWAPTEQSWARGDRTGLCLVVTPAG